MATTPESTKTMREELQNIMSHAHALVDATSGELDEQIKSARIALKERLESAKSEYGQLEIQLRDKAQAADEFIHAKPYYAIGGTFIGGLLLGWFMARK